MNAKPSSQLKELFDAACDARIRSYSPYSSHKVGAAVRTADGKIYSGCNVENSSYGATICAERVAIQKAVSEGSLELREIMVVTDATPPWPPCGMCRQVIAEFNPNETVKVHTANLSGDIKTMQFQEIFPEAFVPKHLKQR